MGAKDVGVERLKFQCDVRLGIDGLEFAITDLEFLTQVYQMRFKGKSSTAVALKQVMSPEMVRLGINGTVKIHAQFRKKKWVSKKCSFDLKVNKRISGALTAPDSVVRRLLNGVLPPLLRRIIVKSLPLELGPFLERLGSDVHVNFSVDVAETISREIWTAALIDSPGARGLLGLTHRQVAVLCLVLSEGSATGRYSGLNASALSIDSLYTYLLKYKCDGDSWVGLAQCWDRRAAAVCPEATPAGWAVQLFGAVLELGRRPLAVEVTFADLDVVVNVKEVVVLWRDIYLRRLAATVKRAKDLKLPHINFQAPDKILGAAADLAQFVLAAVELACGAMERATLRVDVELLGGATLRGSTKVNDLEVNTSLPKKLGGFTPPLAISIPSVYCGYELDDDTGAIHAEVVWKGPMPLKPGDRTAGAGKPLAPRAAALGKGAGKVAKEKDVTLLIATAALESLGLGLKSGRLLLTSDALECRFALNSAMLNNLVLTALQESCAGAVDNSAAAAAAALAFGANVPEQSATTSKEEMDRAVLAFVTPLIFSDAHALAVLFTQLRVTASKPKDKPDTIEVMIKNTGGVGKVNVTLDIAKILTDVLDLVELQNRLWGQGVF